MKIIGLGHYSRVGKDTFADFLTNMLGEYAAEKQVAKIPFAWKLKQIAHDLYRWDGMREPEFYDTDEGAPFRDIPLPTIGKTPVEIWVALGTPAVRECVWDGTWIDYLLKSDHRVDVLIIPDVRFPNECEAIQAAGGMLIKIVRPGYGPRKTVADRALVGYDGWDYIFGGTGRKFELAKRASQLAHSIASGVPMYQSPESREHARSVEFIDPWEQAA